MSRSASFHPSALRATSANYLARTRRRDSTSKSPNLYFGTSSSRLNPRKGSPWDQLQLGEPRFAYKASRDVSVFPLPATRRMHCARVLAQRQQRSSPAKPRGLRPFKDVSQRLSRAISVPPQPLELAITAGAGIVFGSVLITLVLPTAVTALSITAFALPLVLTGVSIVVLTGVLVGSFVLPFTVATGLTVAASMFAGLVLPAMFFSITAFGVYMFLVGKPGEDVPEDESSPATGSDNADVSAFDRLASKKSSSTPDEALDPIQQELLDFDRRLLGDAGKWSVAEVNQWLIQNGFADVAPAFETNGIDGPTLLTLDSQDLRAELGVANLNDRRKLLDQIASIRPEQK